MERQAVLAAQTKNRCVRAGAGRERWPARIAAGRDSHEPCGHAGGLPRPPRARAAAGHRTAGQLRPALSRRLARRVRAAGAGRRRRTAAIPVADSSFIPYAGANIRVVAS